MTSSDAMLTMRIPAGETVNDEVGSFLPLAFACSCTQFKKVENLKMKSFDTRTTIESCAQITILSATFEV